MVTCFRNVQACHYIEHSNNALLSSFVSIWFLKILTYSCVSDIIPIHELLIMTGSITFKQSIGVILMLLLLSLLFILLLFPSIVFFYSLRLIKLNTWADFNMSIESHRCAVIFKNEKNCMTKKWKKNPLNRNGEARVCKIKYDLFVGQICFFFVFIRRTNSFTVRWNVYW